MWSNIFSLVVQACPAVLLLLLLLVLLCFVIAAEGILTDSVLFPINSNDYPEAEAHWHWWAKNPSPNSPCSRLESLAYTPLGLRGRKGLTTPGPRVRNVPQTEIRNTFQEGVSQRAHECWEGSTPTLPLLHKVPPVAPHLPSTRCHIHLNVAHSCFHWKISPMSSCSYSFSSSGASWCICSLPLLWVSPSLHGTQPSICLTTQPSLTCTIYGHPQALGCKGRRQDSHPQGCRSPGEEARVTGIHSIHVY